MNHSGLCAETGFSVGVLRAELIRTNSEKKMFGQV